MSELFVKSMATLELPQVLALLADCAATLEGKERCLALRPLTDLDDVARAQEETSAAVKMLILRGSPGFSGVKPVSASLQRADMGGSLNTRELLDIAGVLTASRRVSDYDAQRQGEETVLDLYCGIGTISLCLARRAGHVIGAEVVPQAVEDARANALRNGVTNAEFFCGDAGEVAARLAGQGVRPQVICVDPPRKGLAPEVPAVLSSMAPDRIVYVSCDPATLARDVKRLEELGYRAVQAQPVDLFPRTAHVETVLRMERRNR